MLYDGQQVGHGGAMVDATESAKFDRKVDQILVDLSTIRNLYAAGLKTKRQLQAFARRIRTLQGQDPTAGGTPALTLSLRTVTKLIDERRDGLAEQTVRAKRSVAARVIASNSAFRSSHGADGSRDA
jgi:hypothetical protein